MKLNKNEKQRDKLGQLTISVLPQGGDMGPDLVHQDFSLQNVQIQNIPINTLSALQQKLLMKMLMGLKTLDIFFCNKYSSRVHLPTGGGSLIFNMVRVSSF